MVNKIRKLITLSVEVLDDIERRTKEGDFNFSEWVERSWVRYNMTEKGIEKQICKSKKDLKTLQNRLNHLKREGSKLLTLYKGNMDIEHKKMLKETKDILRVKPNILDARIRLWNNTFNESLTKVQFLELLELD